MNQSDDKITELISAYIDGEVTPEERARAEALLRDDPDVAAFYQRMTATRSLYNGIKSVDPPASLKANVLLHLKPGRQTGFASRLRELMRPKRTPVPLLTFAGSILVIFAIAYFAYVNLILAPPGSPAGLPSPREEMAAGSETEAVPTADDGDKEKVKVEERALAMEPPPATGDEDTAEADAADTREGEMFAESTQPETLTEPGDMEALRDEAGRPAAPAVTRRVQPPAGAARMARDRAAPTEIEALDAAEPTYFVANQEAAPPPAESEEDDFASQFYVSETVTYIAERGAPARLDFSAPPGSNSNPLTDPSTFLPPRFLSFEFIGRSARPGTDEITVFVETHVARDGSIIYLRLVGQRSSKDLIDNLADRLMATRLIPARGEQDWVSVFYSFVAVIRPAR